MEDANLKLGSVATDVLGVSCRDMLRALAASAAPAIDLGRQGLCRRLGGLGAKALRLDIADGAASGRCQRVCGIAASLGGGAYLCLVGSLSPAQQGL